MKKIRTFFALSALVLFSFISVSHLYTEDKVKSLGENIGLYCFDMAIHSENANEVNLSLATLLSYSLFINGDEFVTRENDRIKNKWRDLIASDPSLAYTAFDLYSASFVESFHLAIDEAKKNLIDYHTENPTDYSASYIDQANFVNSHDVLKSCIDNMKNYDKLIDELLKLDELTLDKFITSVSKDPSCFYSESEKPVEAIELKEWLGKKAFIQPEDLSNTGLTHFGNFPVDLILLTNRISSNYPKWTNRKFLQEAKKFSAHVQQNFK